VTEDAKFCPCCGFILQKEGLSLTTSIGSINHIGISTYLYFLAIKHLIVLLVVMFAIFSVYSIISNGIVSGLYKDEVKDASVAPQEQSYLNVLVISLGSKILYGESEVGRTLFYVQCWMGVVVIVVWGVLFFLIKKI
jgi:hypothetical protein